jgi:hypothetical protein
MALGGKVPKGGTFPPSLQMLKTAFAHLPPPRRRGEQEYGQVFEGEGEGIADPAISINLLFAKTKKSEGGNQLFNFTLKPF